MKNVQFYVSKDAKQFVVSTNNSVDVESNDKELIELVANYDFNEFHTPDVSKDDGEILVKIGKNPHHMTKDHYITNVCYVSIDQIIIKELYPEQESLVRFPDMGHGVIYSYCNIHGLYAIKI